MAAKILVSGQTFIENYTVAVEAAGGIPVAGYLPQLDLSCDGLILCGGVDVDPGLYHEEINGAVDINRERDAHEIELLKAFIDAGKPILGICRGCQLINVFFGGTLHQHLPSTVLHRSGKSPDREHEAEAVPGSMIESLYGRRCVINSVHHQAIKELGEGLTVTQMSDDGVIEAFVHNTLPIFAVQWHPERLVTAEKRRHAVDGTLLFKYFMDMCK